MSTFSTINFSFCILISALVLPTAIATDPLFLICTPNPQNVPSSVDYQRSLIHLLYTFQNLAPATGFSLGSLGLNNQDRPFGLSLCRGDVLGTNCTSCIADARTEIRKRCPYTKVATIWYDSCLIKYSDKDFFGQIDNGTKFYLRSAKDATDAVSFGNKTKELLSGLAVNASSSTRMYAAGEIELDGSNKIYGLAQCSRDLVNDDCEKCLNGAIDEIPICCGGKQGGRVIIGASCTVRYEIYPFVNAYY